MGRTLPAWPSLFCHQALVWLWTRVYKLRSSVLLDLLYFNQVSFTPNWSSQTTTSLLFATTLRTTLKPQARTTTHDVSSLCHYFHTSLKQESSEIRPLIDSICMQLQLLPYARQIIPIVTSFKMKNAILTTAFSTLLSLATAHFELTTPKARGFDENTLDQFPCGGQYSVTTRSEFPIKNGSVTVTLGHASTNVEVLVAFGNSPGSAFNTIIRRPFHVEGLGDLCIIDLIFPPNIGITTGMNATLQVQTNGDVQGGLYNCADITFVEKLSTPQICRLGSVKFSTAEMSGHPNGTAFTESNNASLGTASRSTASASASATNAQTPGMYSTFTVDPNLNSTTAPTSTLPPADGLAKAPQSKAWIAGAVVGPALLLMLIALGIFIFKKRKAVPFESEVSGMAQLHSDSMQVPRYELEHHKNNTLFGEPPAYEVVESELEANSRSIGGRR